jgi:hypothetical protein
MNRINREVSIILIIIIIIPSCSATAAGQTMIPGQFVRHTMQSVGDARACITLLVAACSNL